MTSHSRENSGQPTGEPSDGLSYAPPPSSHPRGWKAFFIVIGCWGGFLLVMFLFIQAMGDAHSSDYWEAEIVSVSATEICTKPRPHEDSTAARPACTTGSTPQAAGSLHFEDYSVGDCVTADASVYGFHVSEPVPC